MNIKEWCRKKGEIEYYDENWECEFENGTEIRKEGKDFAAKVLPKEHYDEAKHMKDIFKSKNPEIENEESLMFGAEEVEFYKGVLVSVPR